MHTSYAGNMLRGEGDIISWARNVLYSAPWHHMVCAFQSNILSHLTTSTLTREFYYTTVQVLYWHLQPFSLPSLTTSLQGTPSGPSVRRDLVFDRRSGPLLASLTRSSSVCRPPPNGPLSASGLRRPQVFGIICIFCRCGTAIGRHCLRVVHLTV